MLTRAKSRRAAGRPDALRLTDLPAAVIVRIAAKLELARDILQFRSSCAYVRANLQADDWQAIAA